MSNSRDAWTSAVTKKAQLGKYGSKKKEVDGYVFDSSKEAARYCELKFRQKAGEIHDLAVHPEYPLRVFERGNVLGLVVAVYKADFRYREGPTGILTIEDVKCKATRTPLYRLKKKIVEANYGIVITEV